LQVEVTNVSPSGLWLLLDGRELFAAFRDFPWFADATIEQLTKVERPSAHHLHWPAIDVDLAVESLSHPEHYPLVSRVRSNKRLQLRRARPASKKSRGQRTRPRS
jgi:hypothetical protein